MHYCILYCSNDVGYKTYFMQNSFTLLNLQAFRRSYPENANVTLS